MARFKIEIKEFRTLNVDEAELITLSEAARRLGLSIKTIAGLIERGKLRRIVDTSERNPRYASRVYIADVEAELARRQLKRRGDARLRGLAVETLVEAETA